MLYQLLYYVRTSGVNFKVEPRYCPAKGANNCEPLHCLLREKNLTNEMYWAVKISSRPWILKQKHVWKGERRDHDANQTPIIQVLHMSMIIIFGHLHSHSLLHRSIDISQSD